MSYRTFLLMSNALKRCIRNIGLIIKNLLNSESQLLLDMSEPTERKERSLNDTEITVLVILLRKYVNEGVAGVTADEVSREAGLSMQHAYKVLRDLTLKGLVTPAKASSLRVWGGRR